MLARVPSALRRAILARVSSALRRASSVRCCDELFLRIFRAAIFLRIPSALRRAIRLMNSSKILPKWNTNQTAIGTVTTTAMPSHSLYHKNLIAAASTPFPIKIHAPTATHAAAHTNTPAAAISFALRTMPSYPLACLSHRRSMAVFSSSAPMVRPKQIHRMAASVMLTPPNTPNRMT